MWLSWPGKVGQKVDEGDPHSNLSDNSPRSISVPNQDKVTHIWTCPRTQPEASCLTFCVSDLWSWWDLIWELSCCSVPDGCNTILQLALCRSHSCITMNSQTFWTIYMYLLTKFLINQRKIVWVSLHVCPIWEAHQLRILLSGKHTCTKTRILDFPYMNVQRLSYIL